mmetsp:Transcript_16066/g.43488  ORF Transcript_16066/g.43488 Transcript_16066/m.43488 type:complete len:109 (-) Transcript_16066:1947-2273(-)
MDSFFSSSWLLGHLPRAAIQREIRLPLLASTLPNARGTRITARIRGEATGKHVMRTLIMIMNTLLARTRCNFFVIIVVSLRRESVEALSVPILRAEQSRWEVESTVVH